jgi:hypothetical protein
MGHLKAYQKKSAFQGWDEYRKGVPEDMLETMQQLFVECRRNGFINPHVRNERIVFDQIISQGSCGDTDPCVMCDRECRKRDDIDTGEVKRQRVIHGAGYVEPRLCWQEPGRSGYAGERPFHGADLVKVRYVRGLMGGRQVFVEEGRAGDLIKRGKAVEVK